MGLVPISPKASPRAWIIFLYEEPLIESLIYHRIKRKKKEPLSVKRGLGVILFTLGTETGKDNLKIFHLEILKRFWDKDFKGSLNIYDLSAGFADKMMMRMGERVKPLFGAIDV